MKKTHLYFVPFLFLAWPSVHYIVNLPKEEPSTVTQAGKDTVIYDNQLGKIVFDPRMLVNKGAELTRQLQRYINDIVDPQTTGDEADMEISQAESLFIPNSYIQVSNVNRIHDSVHTLPVKTYLTNLKLKTTRLYTRVEIKFSKVVYQSPLKMGASGKLYGVVTYTQSFQGFVENKKTYGDITKKSVKFISEKSPVFKNGHSGKEWIVRLGNIRVEETMKTM